MYRTLLFDLDHTILDSDASENAAYDGTMRAVGVPDPAIHRTTYDRINKALWRRVELGELSPDDVRVRRFEELVAATGMDADPEEMADRFVAGLGANGEAYPGAIDVLDAVARRATLALVTNGIGEVQRARISRLDLEHRFAAIVISGEVGVAKPDAAIFDLVFAQLGEPERDSALMIGDSLTSDIAGGAGYGIATCWYNRNGSTSDDVRPTHEIDNLSRLLDLV